MQRIIHQVTRHNNNDEVGLSGPNTGDSNIHNVSDGDIIENIGVDGSIINMHGQSIGGVFDREGGIDVGGAPIITSGGQVSFLGLILVITVFQSG